MTWDLKSYFPQFNGPEMLRFKEDLRSDVAFLKERARAVSGLNQDNLEAWEAILLSNEDLSRRMSHLSSYVGCLAASDARNEAYLKEESALIRLRAEFAKVRIELLRAFKDAPEEVFSALQAKPSLSGA